MGSWAVSLQNPGSHHCTAPTPCDQLTTSSASISLYQLLGYSEKPLTLQMFIGTADERNLRPHAFYQVHRITGKMVATASYEAVVSGTKVLEMTLLPENNMAAK